MVVVAFGGSLVAPAEFDTDYLGRLADALVAWSRDSPVHVVVGGGIPARRHITAGRAAGMEDEADLDRLGIQATRLNAQLVAGLVKARGGDVNQSLPHTTEDAAGMSHDIVVMGGTAPGHSTDQVAAELAIAVGADRLVIATNVDGVYTADPRMDPNAKRVTEADFDRLRAIVGDSAWQTAGQSGVIDGPATDLITQHQLTTCVVHGADLANVRAAVTGEAFNGTIIH